MKYFFHLYFLKYDLVTNSVAKLILEYKFDHFPLTISPKKDRSLAMSPINIKKNKNYCAINRDLGFCKKKFR